MVYEVALIGHSQLPSLRDYDDVVIREFKSRGAHIQHVLNSDRFDSARIRNKQWDCVILFLGGNDLCSSRDADQVVNHLLDLANAISASTILITEIETRTYYPRFQERYGITTKDYNILATRTNQKLKRRAKSQQTFRVIHCPHSYNLDSRDGIHITPQAETSLIIKYQAAIRHARAR